LRNPSEVEVRLCARLAAQTSLERLVSPPMSPKNCLFAPVAYLFSKTEVDEQSSAVLLTGANIMLLNVYSHSYQG